MATGAFALSVTDMINAHPDEPIDTDDDASEKSFNIPELQENTLDDLSTVRSVLFGRNNTDFFERSRRILKNYLLRWNRHRVQPCQCHQHLYPQESALPSLRLNYQL